ncbi:MAG: presqualene diphosphate synthase HpnD [Nitrosomonadales bacterium]|jgi:phytoene synthase|nr:presqualene diphosphate synthase HpnD [Nitrosomonadales bacterium]MBT3918426.1 presqualene diphosphate synthase HpnD [Nitrosomonadales bacterium]MBT4182710.1 presqualene diphosphate synthase HpnD [Nitrosomonadales bacterium]MBT4570649.1 presqualene diphosphate synthase HpnD [Nitrosomonadales bacterium]MBT4759184.1 presqualene diphosphate synthase HpnD [Nitrosomonadales bacterium]
MTPQEYCQQKTKESHSNFLTAFIFLKKEKREALTALYAFCREVDDIADECLDHEVASSKLNWWREEIERLFKGAPQHPVSKALHPFISLFELSKAHFDEIIDGMEMDVKLNRYESFKQLQLYCYRVASCVGILSAHIFGFKNKNTLKFAHNLGIALQLTNIIRDLGEDARRGRIYIPLDELAKLGISEEEIISLKNGEKIKALVKSQVERAKQFYGLAIESLPSEDKKSQKIGLVMGNIYYVLLNKIEKDDPEKILNQKTTLPWFRKLIISILTMLDFSWINKA